MTTQRPGLPGASHPSGGSGGRAPMSDSQLLDQLQKQPTTSCEVLRMALAMLEQAHELYEAGHTLAASGELRSAVRMMKQLDLDERKQLPQSVDTALRSATQYFQTRGNIDAALAYAALFGLQLAELRTLTLGQQEQFALRMAELVRAYRTGGKQ